MATYTINIDERTQEGRGIVTYLREKGLIPPFKTAHKPTKQKQGISPELQAKLDRAREEYKKGNYVSCSTKEELNAFLEAL